MNTHTQRSFIALSSVLHQLGGGGREQAEERKEGEEERRKRTPKTTLPAGAAFEKLYQLISFTSFILFVKKG